MDRRRREQLFRKHWESKKHHKTNTGSHVRGHLEMSGLILNAHIKLMKSKHAHSLFVLCNGYPSFF